MKERDALDESDKMYTPLYRSRFFNFEERVRLKGVEKYTWYSDFDLKDPYRNNWKFRIRRRGDIETKTKRSKKCTNPPTTTTMFVPSTQGGRLTQMLEEVEETLSLEVGWKPKIIEQSGLPLMNVFRSKMPIKAGCPMSLECKICDGDAIKCSVKGAVYQAVCLECEESRREEDLGMNEVRNSPKYIGETSRPLRMRAREHYTKLNDLKTDSFMATHWVQEHGLSMIPPRFKFTVIKSFGDSFSRQISEALHIEKEGTLNKRAEYGSNHLHRLVADKSPWLEEQHREKEARIRANWISDIIAFSHVYKNVLTKCNNLNSSCRSKISLKRPLLLEMSTKEEQEVVTAMKKKKLEVCSTPTLEYRSVDVMPEDFGDLTPIKRSPIFDLNGTVDSIHHSSLSTSGGEKLQTGISPKLRKLLIAPRNETELAELKRVLTETINLTRAALARGLLERRNSAPDLDMKDKLEDNTFFRQGPYARSSSLSNLLHGLDLNAWEQEDIHSTFHLPHGKDNERQSILRPHQDQCNVMDVDNILDSRLGEVDAVGIVITPKTPVDSDMRIGASPVLKNRKRQFSPTEGTQIGNLPKHPTTVKKNDQVRRKLNQTVFTGSDKNILTLMKGEKSLESPKRRKKYSKRRLNEQNKSSLHTSIFSPRAEAATSILSPQMAPATSILWPQIRTGVSSGKEEDIDKKHNVEEDKKTEGVDSQKKPGC